MHYECFLPALLTTQSGSCSTRGLFFLPCDLGPRRGSCDVRYTWSNSYIWTAVVDPSEEWSSQLIFQFKQLERRSLKKSRLQRDSYPWPLRYRCDVLPTELWSHTLGARSIYWVHISREEWNDVKYIWNNSYIWTAVVDPSEEWSSQLIFQFKQLLEIEYELFIECSRFEWPAVTAHWYLHMSRHSARWSRLRRMSFAFVRSKIPQWRQHCLLESVFRIIFQSALRSGITVASEAYPRRGYCWLKTFPNTSQDDLIIVSCWNTVCLAIFVGPYVDLSKEK